MKKQYIYIGVSLTVGLLLAYAFGLFDKKSDVPKGDTDNSKSPKPKDLPFFANNTNNIHRNAGDSSTISNALKEVEKKYGNAIAKKVEKIYRIETRNFESGQYKLTYSPGMEIHGETYPYGWSTPAKVWGLKNGVPSGYIDMNENGTGLPKRFLRFPSLELAMLSVAEYVKKYGAARWYSTEADKKMWYAAQLLRTKTTYV